MNNIEQLERIVVLLQEGNADQRMLASVINITLALYELGLIEPVHRIMQHRTESLLRALSSETGRIDDIQP